MLELRDNRKGRVKGIGKNERHGEGQEGKRRKKESEEKMQSVKLEECQKKRTMDGEEEKNDKKGVRQEEKQTSRVTIDQKMLGRCLQRDKQFVLSLISPFLWRDPSVRGERMTRVSKSHYKPFLCFPFLPLSIK